LNNEEKLKKEKLLNEEKLKKDEKKDENKITVEENNNSKIKLLINRNNDLIEKKNSNNKLKSNTILEIKTDKEISKNKIKKNNSMIKNNIEKNDSINIDKIEKINSITKNKTEKDDSINKNKIEKNNKIIETEESEQDENIKSLKKLRDSKILTEEEFLSKMKLIKEKNIKSIKITKIESIFQQNGYLEKKNSNELDFKKYYFYLKEDRLIYFSKLPSDKNDIPEGFLFFNLGFYSLPSIIKIEIIKEFNNFFTIKFQNGDDVNEIILKSSSDDECLGWVTKIKKLMDLLHQESKNKNWNPLSIDNMKPLKGFLKRFHFIFINSYGSFNSFSKRYFVLRDGILFCYKNEDMKICKNKMPLYGFFYFLFFRYDFRGI
jgi:hypothetical protein